MSVRVRIPTVFRRFTGEAGVLDCSVRTLPELLNDLEERFPGLRPHLRDASGGVRSFLNVYVNEEDIRFLGGSEYRFRDGDEITLVPSIAGGSPAAPRDARPFPPGRPILVSLFRSTTTASLGGYDVSGVSRSGARFDSSGDGP